MSAVNLQRRPAGWQRRVGALLLVLQVTVGTAVTLAQAAEATGGPTTIEAHHTAQCIVLHDAARCALCQHHATRPLPSPQRRLRLSAGAGRPLGSPGRPRSVYFRSRDRAAPPRGPPPPPPHLS